MAVTLANPQNQLNKYYSFSILFYFLLLLNTHHTRAYIYYQANINMTIRTMDADRPQESKIICITGKPVLEFMVLSKSWIQNKNPIIKQKPVKELTTTDITIP